MPKVIKISDENYKFLAREVAKIQYNAQERISFDDAITRLREQKEKKREESLKKAHGSWADMTDNECEAFKKELRDRWKTWDKRV